MVKVTIERPDGTTVVIENDVVSVIGITDEGENYSVNRSLSGKANNPMLVAMVNEHCDMIINNMKEDGSDD